MKSKVLVFAGIALSFSTLLSAASLSGSGQAVQPFGQEPRGGFCGTDTLTQSSSQAITPLNSVSCNDGTGHTDNSYFRSFPITAIAYPAGFSACSLEVGVETASGAGGTQPVTVNLYSNVGGVFPAGTRTSVGTATVQVPDQAGTIINVPVTGTVAAGAELIVELFTPDGTTAGNLFFMGSNAAAESGTSFLAAAGCGITAPTATAAIGFPDFHFVMNVHGSPAGAGAGALTITPTTADFGTQIVGTTSAPQSVTFANTGGSSLDITSITAAAAPFARSGGSCGAGPTITIAAGTSCTIDYTFSPTNSGAANQALVVTANAPGGGTINLIGNGQFASSPIPATSTLGLVLASLLIVLGTFWVRRRA